MNCITRSLPRIVGIATLVYLGAASVAAADDGLAYGIRYTVRPDPIDRSIEVTLQVTQSRALLRQLSMQADDRVTDIAADGDLQFPAAGVSWRPPPEGGRMQWRVRVDHRRNGDGYDAWLGDAWGLFRAEDIIPRAATRTLRGAVSNTEIVFDLPKNWSVVTQYFGRDRVFRVANPERRFDQPSGWIILGDVGVRRERIATTRVAVAGPVGQSVRRMDTLALLNWTLPELARLVPEMPARLTVFSAGEPMWRGGLSAPQSLFVHTDRPLISENATSTLLHEVMHLALGIRAADGYDWIVEGLAEYYSLELLGRSGTISASRYETARTGQRKWGKSADTLCKGMSSGATSALAVSRFADLDQEIRTATSDRASLDDVVRTIWQMDERINLDTLVGSTEALIGRKPDTLHIDNLPGCRNIEGNQELSQDN